MPAKVFAQVQEHTVSAKLAVSEKPYSSDPRINVLKAYLASYNSPLTDSASTFVESADRYSLDWKLVAAISGVESTFGHQIPYESFNGWGWGVYGTNVIRFNSWNEAIVTISKALREKYLRNISESDPYVIGPTYAASPAWATHVDSFMQQIASFEVNHAKDQLSISL